MAKMTLWLLALLIMISAIIYQRTTGPTYPFRGTIEASGIEYSYRLLRSQETVSGAKFSLPDVKAENYSATLHYKRFKTKDEFTAAPMNWETPKDSMRELVAALPVQQSAGKMEYYLTVNLEGADLRIPEAGQENIVLRYKDPVPSWILIPHIFMMFFSVLFGMRTGLAAIFKTDDMRKLAFITLGGMTFGGMILGPIVQKFAFGEYWTGFPFGGDLTDNKMLIMWVSWLVAVAVIGTRPRKKEGISRTVVICAALVMTAVYLIPHSMRGSELDYTKVDQGIAPEKAIGTGD